MIGFWLAAGCAGRPFEYHSQNEIPAGAGIFSGAFAEGTPEDEDVKAALVNDFETFQRWKRDPRNASEY